MLLLFETLILFAQSNFKGNASLNQQHITPTTCHLQ